MGAITASFDFKVKDRKGTKKQVVDHLSRLEDKFVFEVGEKCRNL